MIARMEETQQGDIQRLRGIFGEGDPKGIIASRKAPPGPPGFPG